MKILGTPEFWVAVGSIATMVTTVLSSKKTRKHVDSSTYEIRELRRALLEHLRDHSNSAGRHKTLF